MFVTLDTFHVLISRLLTPELRLPYGPPRENISCILVTLDTSHVLIPVTVLRD